MGGLDQVRSDLYAANDVLGLFAHQGIVGGNVGLALNPVDDQGVNDMIIGQM